MLRIEVSTTKFDVKDCEKRRRSMPLQALGYAGFGSSSLDDWRPVLRCRLEPAGARQRHSGPSHQRPHDFVLRQDAVILYDRVQLGRSRDRSAELAAVRTAGRPEAVG